MAERGRVRRGVARGALVVSAAAAGWSLLLAVTGGFGTSIFGLPIRSHNATRPLLVAAVAFGLFVWARGIRDFGAIAAAVARAADPWLARRRLPHRALVVAMSAAVLIIGVAWGTGVAGGSDSYGYISQSDLWRSGVPIVPQPWTSEVPWPDADWTFSPLGYQPAREGGAIVPGYAVGLPLLMAAAKTVAGHGAVFWLAPLAGAILVLVTYEVGKWLDSATAGLIAAWLAATSAPVILEVPAPMSDVIAAAALAGACWLLLRSTGRLPVAAGAAAALAVVVRPNLAPTVAVLALFVAVWPDAPREGRLRSSLRGALFLAAASPGLLLVAWANWRLFGSPFVSGYGDVESIYDWSRVPTNLWLYPAILLRSRALPALVGFAMLLIPARRLWPRIGDRRVLAGVALFTFSIVAQYLAYESPSGVGYLRFLLPCWPFVMTGAARALLLVARPGWPAALLALALVGYGVSGVQWACANHGCTNRSERKYPGAGAIVRSRTEPGSIVYAFQHSGSLRYYAGRMTLRYDQLDPRWLDRSVEWFAARGVHSYVVLDEWELARFRERFAGQRRVAHIDRPVATYRGDVVTYFFDLLDRPDERGDPEEWVDRFDGPWYPQPVGPITFDLSGPRR